VPEQPQEGRSDRDHKGYVSTPPSKSGFDLLHTELDKCSPMVFSSYPIESHRGFCPVEERNMIHTHLFSSSRSNMCPHATIPWLQSGYSYSMYRPHLSVGFNQLHCYLLIISAPKNNYSRTSHLTSQKVSRLYSSLDAPLVKHLAIQTSDKRGNSATHALNPLCISPGQTAFQADFRFQLFCIISFG
jgi:hypothetical protein